MFAAALTPPTLLDCSEGFRVSQLGFTPAAGRSGASPAQNLLACKHISVGQIPDTHTHIHSVNPPHTHTLSDRLSFRQTRPAAERDRHAAAPQPGQADAPPRGLHPHLHRLCKLQPQAHRRGHLPTARRAPQAHRVPRVSGAGHGRKNVDV